MTYPQFLPGIAALASRFEGFILDLWGVLHDGEHPYPGAVEALENLRGAGKKIIMLSNAPRQSFKAKEVLDRIGFHADHYDHLLTSGQAARDWLIENQPYGDTYYYVGPQKDRDLLGDTRYREVAEAGKAGFCLLTGFDEFGDGMETKLPQMEAALGAKLPVICANPDRTVVKQDGRVMLCAGLLAEWYVARGGHVDWFGKPYKAVYEQCCALFEVSGFRFQETEAATPLKPETRNLKPRICAIGDSLHTDVAGAKAMGIHAVLCAGGILAEPLGIKPGEQPSPEALEELCAEEGVTPDAVIPAFRW